MYFFTASSYNKLEDSKLYTLKLYTLQHSKRYT